MFGMIGQLRGPGAKPEALGFQQRRRERWLREANNSDLDPAIFLDRVGQELNAPYWLRKHLGDLIGANHNWIPAALDALEERGDDAEINQLLNDDLLFQLEAQSAGLSAEFRQALSLARLPEPKIDLGFKIVDLRLAYEDRYYSRFNCSDQDETLAEMIEGLLTVQAALNLSITAAYSHYCRFQRLQGQASDPERQWRRCLELISSTRPRQ
jgi:hypothetical protein